jgi:hypothetical protein
MRDRLPLNERQIDQLLADLCEVPSEAVGGHLDADVCLAYVDDTLKVKAHEACDRNLASCPSCAAQAEAAYLAAGFWLEEAGEVRLDRVRERAHSETILPTVHYGRRALAEYVAGRAPNADSIRRHLDDEGCARCLKERDSAPVRALASLLMLPSLTREMVARLWDSPTLTAPALYGGAIRVAEIPGGGLLTAPSARDFGGPNEELSDHWGASVVGAPAAYALGRLYSLNGRLLPREAEIFWGHEIWLIQVPYSVLLRRDVPVESLGIQVEAVDGQCEILEVLPQGPWLRPPNEPGEGTLCEVDLLWNGRVRPPDSNVAVEPTVQPLAFGGAVHLVDEASLVGRLSFPVGAPGVRAATATFTEATCVLQLDVVRSPVSGSVCLLVVADKRLRQLVVEIRLWLESRGLNDVRLHVAGERSTVEVSLGQ